MLTGRKLMTKTRRSRRFLMRTLNLAFLLILLAVLAGFSGAMYLVHGMQVQRKASSLLDRARIAEAANDLEKTEQALRQYLRLERKHGPTWKRYARVVDQRDSYHRGRERVFLVHEQALRYNPGDPELERRCADLALELGRYKEAQSHLMSLLEKADKDSQRQPAAAAARAELEDLLGQCSRGLTLYEDAEKWFEKSIQHDPGRLACYDRLARLRRTDLRRIEAADGTIRDMVAKNPQAGRVYTYRWRYAQEFAPPAEAADIPRALKLAPDDPEVLLTAAIASEQKADPAAARPYWEKGLKLDPRSVPLSLGLARLEVREKHPDRAEAVLRQAYQANPSVNLAFELADTLIIQDKIDGKDQAGDYITLLRKAGLGDTYVRYLEARILVQRKQWAEAIRPIDDARNALNFDPRLVAQLNLMLAECYGRVGDEKRRLDALWLAAEGDRAPESARIDLAQAMARSGKPDQALAILLPLADRSPELRLDIVRLLIQRTLKLPQDQRRWQEVEQRLQEAEKALPGAVEDLTALRAELLGLQNKPDAAKSVLEQAIQRNPRSVRSRIALAALLLGRNDLAHAKEVLDQAEKDLGASTTLLRARVEFWSRRGGDEAKKAMVQLAESRHQIPAAEQPAFLDELARVFYRLGDSARAAQLWGELSQQQPDNLGVLILRADLAVAARDRSAVEEIVNQMKRVEGEGGTLWRYAQAAFLIGEIGRSDATDSEAARQAATNLVDEILTRRGDWWGGLMLRGRLADLRGKPDDAIRDYLQAVDLGGSQPGLARHLFVLLYQRQQFDQIDQVVSKLGERGMAPDDLKLATALNALRQKDFARAITLAREVLPETSTSASDLLILCNVLLQAGRIDEVEKPLRRARELAPALPGVWIAEIQFLQKAGRAGEIARVLDQAARALPRDQAARTLALCHSIAGSNEEADKFFQSALSLQPGDVTTLRLAAEFYIKVLRLDKAAPLIEKLLDPETKATPADLNWAKRARGLVKMRSGDPRQIDEALALIEQNLKNSPYSFNDQRARAILLTSIPKRREEGIRTLETLGKTRMLSSEDQFLLAQLYAANRSWPKYMDLMRGLLNERNPAPIRIAHFVSALIDQKDLDQAERWLERFKPASADSEQDRVRTELKARLLKVRKRDDELLTLLQSFSKSHPDPARVAAEMFERYGYLKEAEQGYRTFMAQNTKEPIRMLPLARVLGEQNRTQEALDLCEQAWKNCPPEAVAATSVAILSAGKNITDEQRHSVELRLEDALRRLSSSVQVRLSLATLRNMQRRYNQSESIYREVLGGSPNNLEALNNLAWLLAFESGKEREALELINQAIEIAGSDATLLDTRAVVYLRLEKTDLALQDLRAGVAINPEKAVLYFHLARALQMASNPAEAREAFRQAEQLGLKPETVDPRERELFLRVRQELSLSAA